MPSPRPRPRPSDSLGTELRDEGVVSVVLGWGGGVDIVFEETELVDSPPGITAMLGVVEVSSVDGTLDVGGGAASGVVVEVVEVVDSDEVDISELVLAGMMMEDVTIVVETALGGVTSGVLDTTDSVEDTCESVTVLVVAAAEAVGTSVLDGAAESAMVVRKRGRSVSSTRIDIVNPAILRPGKEAIEKQRMRDEESK